MRRLLLGWTLIVGPSACAKSEPERSPPAATTDARRPATRSSDAAAASPASGKLVATGSNDGAASARFCGLHDRVMVVTTGGAVRVWNPVASTVEERTVAGEVLDCGAGGHVVTRHNDNLEAHRFADGLEACHNSAPFALSPDGRTLAVVGARAVRLQSLEFLPERGSSAVAPGGPCLAEAIESNRALLRAAAGSVTSLLDAERIEIDPDSTMVAARAGNMGQIWRLDALTEPPAMFRARPGSPLAIRGGRLAVVTSDGPISVDELGGKAASVVVTPAGPVTALAITRAGDALVIGHEDGAVIRHALPDGVATTLGNLGEPVTAIAIAADESVVAAASATHARFWRPAGEQVGAVDAPQVSISADARRALAVIDGTAQVWTLKLD